ncbi:MAG: hypothetical protein ACW98Y_06980 [Candidatus Thorarchaeota archaeon]
MGEEEIPKWPLYASISLAILYILTGIIYILSGLGLVISLPASNDIIGSFMLLIVGGVYLVGIQYLLKQQREGYAFTLVATALAAVLFALHSIVFGTNALGAILGLEDWIHWTPLDSLSPGLWLFGVIAIIIGCLKLTDRLGGEKGIFPIEG